MTALHLVAGTLLGLGTFLIALAVLGLIRLPDLYIRINAVTKAASLGVVCVLLGVLVWTPGPRTALAVLPAIALQLLTAPLSGYATARAAYRTRVPRSELTHRDDLSRRDAPGERDGPDGRRGPGPGPRR